MDNIYLLLIILVIVVQIIVQLVKLPMVDQSAFHVWEIIIWKDPPAPKHVRQDNMGEHKTIHVSHVQPIVPHVLHQMDHLFVKVVLEFLF